MPVRIPLMSSSNVETKAIGGKTSVCGFMNTVQIGERRKAFKRLGFTAILFVIALGSAAAQTLPPPCPSSPNYTDFSSNRNCLALNGSANSPSVPCFRSLRTNRVSPGPPGTALRRLSKMGLPPPSSSSSQTRRLLQQTESPLSFRIPVRQQSVPQEAAAPWLMATAIRALIRARGLGFPTAWRSSSILFEMVGIQMSAMWPFRAAARDPIRHTITVVLGRIRCKLDSG